MNRMYKVPLIILLTLVLIGLCYIGWRSWKPPKTAGGSGNTTVKKETKPAKKNDAKKPPELAKADPAKTAKKPESKPLEPPAMAGEKPVIDPANANKPEVKPAEQKPAMPQPKEVTEPKPPVVVPPVPEVKPEPPKAAEPPAAVQQAAVTDASSLFGSKRVGIPRFFENFSFQKRKPI